MAKTAASVDYFTSRPKTPNAEDHHVTQSRNLIGQDEVNLVTQQDEDGDTLLHIAVAKGNELACRYLAALFLNANVTLDIRNHIMQTPLHVSCIVDNPSITRLLIQANPASCDVTDRHGNNCVHLAAKHSKDSTQFESLKAALEVASPSTLKKKNLYGYTPMHVAAIEGKPESIRILKKAGADINALDNRGGASPLILATRASQREAAQALLELGANPALKTTYGETASQLASAKADHVISELLALYDSPNDGPKAAGLPRYLNTKLTSSSKSNVKQISPRSRDVKMKPFVNVPPSARHVNIHPIASAIRHAMPFPSPSPPNQNVKIKSERQSPANPFPSNSKQQLVSVSTRRDNVNQATDFALRGSESRKSESPAGKSPSLKRKIVTEDDPLDLSVKKTKHSESSLSREPTKRTSANSKSSDKHAFAQPVYRHVPSLPLSDRPESHSYVSPKHAAAGTTAALRKSSGYACTSVPRISSASPGGHRDRRSDFVQYVQLPDGTVKEVSVDDLKRRAMDSRLPSRYVLSNQHPQHLPSIPKISTESPKTTQKNGLFYPVQIVDPALLGLLNPMSLANAYHANPHLHPQHPIKRLSYETRDKFQPPVKRVESRDANQPIADPASYPRDKKETKKQHPTLEQIHSLPSTFQPRQNVADETVYEIPSSLNRERRYQSDGVCYDFNRFLDKQTANRRNSAPVQAKTHNEKLDLRSYTGCLPPHYLHLLESSGNLPIRSSNVLRNVADVLRNNVKANVAASKYPDKRKLVELPMREPSMTSRTPSSDVISISGLSPNVMSPNIATTPSKSSMSPNTVSKASRLATETAIPDYLNKLGDWSAFESGSYPAFGKFAELDKDKVKPPPIAPQMLEYTVDEKYISNDTKRILQNASSAQSKASKAPCLRTILSTGCKHSCHGCRNIKKNVPSLVSDIWRFSPHSHYVTSAGPSSDVVYCWQVGLNKSAALPASVTSNIDDVRKTSSEDLSRTSTSVPRTIITPFTTKKEQGLSMLASRPDQLRGAFSVQRSMTEKSLKHNGDAAGHGNSLATDDMLENVIEASDDDEESGVISSAPLVNGHVTRPNLMAIHNGFISNKNGFHNHLTDVIQKTILQNLERDVVRKFGLHNVHALLSSEKKLQMRNDAYKDVQISDLEISDDEETDKKS